MNPGATSGPEPRDPQHGQAQDNSRSSSRGPALTLFDTVRLVPRTSWAVQYAPQEAGTTGSGSAPQCRDSKVQYAPTVHTSR